VGSSHGIPRGETNLSLLLDVNPEFLHIRNIVTSDGQQWPFSPGNIQNALTHIGAGGAVYLPAGSITESFTILKEQALYGRGFDQTIITAEPGSSGIVIQDYATPAYDMVIMKGLQVIPAANQDGILCTAGTADYRTPVLDLDLAFSGGNNPANYMLNLENPMTHGSRINFRTVGAISHSGVRLFSDHTTISPGNIHFPTFYAGLANVNDLIALHLQAHDHALSLCKFDFFKVSGTVAATGQIALQLELDAAGDASRGIQYNRFEMLDLEGIDKAIYLLRGDLGWNIRENHFVGGYIGSSDTGFENTAVNPGKNFVEGLEFITTADISDLGGTVFTDISKWPTTVAIGATSELNPVMSFFYGMNANLAFGNTKYLYPGSLGNTMAADNLQIPITRDAYLRRIFVRSTNTLNANTVFTVMDDGGASALTCTLGAGVDEGDATGLVAMSAGDRLSVQIDTTASGAGQISNLTVTLEFCVI